MKVYQQDWIESLEEYTEGWNKDNLENNVLGVCCEIIGDDTGGTDPLARTLAIILQRMIAERIANGSPKGS